MKILLDTNAAIALEDPGPISSTAASLAASCERYGVKRYVCDANYDDVESDKNASRASATRTKLNKFPRLSNIALPPESELQEAFGPNKGDNDSRDLVFLGILQLGAVDFLVTEDNKLRKRAERAGYGNQVLDIQEMLSWICQSYQPETIDLPYIEEVLAYEVDQADPIFDSLRQDYPEFSSWFREKCVNDHRLCWVVKVDGRMAGIAIRKEEHPSEAQCQAQTGSILKISTFVISPEFQGEKFGEQLLKQVLWWAQENRIKTVYLTAYPKHERLIDLLKTFGFGISSTLEDEQYVIERELFHGELPEDQETPLLDKARQYYPRYHDGPDAKKFVVPIKPRYHRILFPEISDEIQPDLFAPISSMPNRRPGNTIRKVYICRASTKQLKSGDLIFFYATKQKNYFRSQKITSVGIVEQIQYASDCDELIRLTARRSVFSVEQLEDYFSENQTPVMVISFLLAQHFDSGVPLESLLEKGIFRNRPPQTIAKLDSLQYSNLCAACREIGK